MDRLLLKIFFHVFSLVQLMTSPFKAKPEVRKGIVKSRIITGTYILQIDRHKFSQYNIDPNCPFFMVELTRFFYFGFGGMFD
jgi:hypothetical protein